MGNRWIVRGFLLAAAGATLYAGELELQPATLKTWTEYEHAAESAMQKRLHGAGSFLRVGEDAERIARVRAGEIVVWSALDTNPRRIQAGLIHDWIGAAFIPNARIADVISVVRDYRHYSEFYKPGVLSARLLRKSGGEDQFNMMLRNPSFFTKTALDGDFDSNYIRLDDKRWYSVTRLERVQEIEDYGQPAERKLPPDRGHGYIWRMASLSQMEERDGGVYVEEEVLALSRDVPAAIRWMAGPIIRRVARESTAASIDRTRRAVGAIPDVVAAARASKREEAAAVCLPGSAASCLR